MIRLSDGLRFRIRLLVAQADRQLDHLTLWVAARLPHRLITFVIAHVGAATIRGNEIVPDARFMELYGRWVNRDLTGRAAQRHGRNR
jgi:hypothetical protein